MMEQAINAMRGALDALEYLDRSFPNLAGYAVRAERIKELRAAIAAAEPAQGVPRVRGERDLMANQTHIAGIDIARLLRNLDETSYNEGSEALACRLSDCKAVIAELLATPSSDQHAGSIDTPEFSSLLSAYKSTGLKGAGLRAELIAHIDRHTSEAVQAALEEAAKACDEKFNQRQAGGFPREASTARALADEIRALATKKEQANG